MTGVILPYSSVSHTPEGQLGLSWHCQGSKWKCEKHIRPVWPRLRTDTFSFLPHFIGQSNSAVRGTVKSHGKGYGYRVGEELGPLIQFSHQDTIMLFNEPVVNSVSL